MSSSAPAMRPANRGPVNSPPGASRTCSSSRRESCGGEAIEKLRRRPLDKSTSTYWPGWKSKRSAAGSFKYTETTSGASCSMRSMRLGRRLASISSGVAGSNVSRMRSLAARAWQSRTSPSARSASESPRGDPFGYRTSPSSSRARQEPQLPLLQLCGRFSPARSAASSTDWPGSMPKLRPDLATVARTTRYGWLRLLSSHSMMGSHCFQSGHARYSGSSSTPMPRAYART